MKAMLRNTLLGGALVAQLLSACAADTGPMATAADKPLDGKSDAISRLCADAGKPADCDICEVRGWYHDGACDEFCASPDPDCAPPPAARYCGYDVTSPLGEISADLRAISGRARRVTFADRDSLTTLAIDQIVAAVAQEYTDVEGDSLAEMFAAADDGTFFLEELTHSSGSYQWIRFYAGETEVGTVFENGTTTAVAKISDGEVMGCEAAPPAPPAPEPAPVGPTYSCDVTMHSFPDDSTGLTPTSTATYHHDNFATVPEGAVEQISEAVRHRGAVASDASFEAMFAAADDEEFQVMTLEVGAANYDWVRWWGGDTEVGVIFEAGTVVIVAEITDQWITGCRADAPSR